MQFFSSLLFGVSANLDSLLVGISYGLRRVRIRLWQNLFISLVTLLGTCLSISMGHLLIPLLSAALCSCAGSLILIFLGIYYLVKWGISSLRDEINSCGRLPDSGKSVSQGKAICKTASQDEDRPAGRKNFVREIASASAGKKRDALSPAEVLSLSLTLSLNNLGIGLSASLAGLTLFSTAAATLICSLFLLFLGNRLGSCRPLQLAGTAADPVSGILLIGLGIVQLF